MSSSKSRFTEDLTNAEAFQLFSCKLDAAMAENKKIDFKRIRSQKGKRILLTSNLNTIKRGTIFLTDIQSDFEKIEKRFDFGDIAIVKDVIKNSVLRIKEQKKVVRIADKYGWDVAKEFKDDPITENSEESQRLRQAEARAKRKRFDKKGFSNPFRGDSKFVQPRYAPYPRFQFNSAGWNNGGSQSGPYRIQPDQ